MINLEAAWNSQRVLWVVAGWLQHLSHPAMTVLQLSQSRSAEALESSSTSLKNVCVHESRCKLSAFPIMGLTMALSPNPRRAWKLLRCRGLAQKTTREVSGIRTSCDYGLYISCLQLTQNKITKRGSIS